MQLHLGALRNNNTRMFHILGPDTGYDSMGDFSMARDLNGFLNALDTSDQLPKTIIYTVNPILLSDSCYEATLEAVKFAKEKGVFVSFDPNLRFALINRVGEDISRDRILSIAKLVNLMLPGIDEAVWLLGNKESKVAPNKL